MPWQVTPCRSHHATHSLTSYRPICPPPHRRASERETLDLAHNILRGIQAPDNLPFELVVLEALLNATVDYFSRQLGALKWMMHSVTGSSELEDAK
jgi:hypothetical protein